MNNWNSWYRVKSSRAQQVPGSNILVIQLLILVYALVWNTVLQLTVDPKTLLNDSLEIIIWQLAEGFPKGWKGSPCCCWWGPCIGPGPPRHIVDGWGEIMTKWQHSHDIQIYIIILTLLTFHNATLLMPNSHCHRLCLENFPNTPIMKLQPNPWPRLKVKIWMPW